MLPRTTYLLSAAATLLLTAFTLDGNRAAAAITADEPRRTPGDATLDSSTALVGIPSSYVHDPRLGSLHDYCSGAPNEFANGSGARADFRGPCARHDLCLDDRVPQQACNNRLWIDMVINCLHEYRALRWVKRSCIDTAHIYWTAVTARTGLTTAIRGSGASASCADAAACQSVKHRATALHRM